MLIESNDRNVVKSALNFFTTADIEDFDESDEEETAQMRVITDEDQRVEVAKLTNKLKQRITKFSLDQNRKKKDIDVMRKQIFKIHNKLQADGRGQLYIIDYLRDPQSFAEQLTKKFLMRDTPFTVKLTIFEYTSRLIERYQLVVPAFYSILVKYLRPRQQDIVQILNDTVRSVHAGAGLDDVFLLIKQIMNEFIHSGSTDEEMTIAITSITEMAKRLPEVFLEGDNVYILNEIVSFSREKNVDDAHETAQSGSKTCARTRRGVVRAAKELLNFYRETAPAVLEKKYQNKESAVFLHKLKKLADAGVEPGVSRVEQILNAESSEEESDGDAQPSKHLQLKAVRDRARAYQVIRAFKRRGEAMPESVRAAVEGAVGPFGDGENDEPGACVRAAHAPAEALEESFEAEEEEFYESESESESATASFCLEEQLADVVDPDLPLEQQRILTEEELARLRATHLAREEFDVNGHVVRRRATSEERRATSKASKDGEDHKSNYWNRKEAGKSRTNKEKQINKPMLMVLHSRDIRQKQGRSANEKDYVMRTHMRNQKRGITKKVKR